MGVEIAALLGQGFELGKDFLELSDAVAKSGKITSVEGVDVRTWSDDAREPVHAWIDFSRPEATMEMLEHIDAPVVIGTTGFSDAEKKRIAEYAKKHAVLLAANTSPGMSVVRKAIAEALPPAEWGFKAFVTEAHHTQKKDSPSGSANEILRLVEKAGYADVPVHAIRAGGIVGEHELRLVSETEEILIVHRVFDRKVFARGALLGAARLLHAERKTGVYSWDELFK